MCGYFDDLNLRDGLESAVSEGWITKAEATATSEFHQEADTYQAPSGGDEAVIKDAKWTRVVGAAQRAWSQLRRLVSNDELEYMRSLERKWGAIRAS